MALGTATHDSRVSSSPGPVTIDVLTFAGDDNYQTGGTANFEAYVRSALGLGNVDLLGVVPLDCAGHVPVYDKANDTLKVYLGGGASTALAEVGNGSDLSGTTFNVLVIAR